MSPGAEESNGPEALSSGTGLHIVPHDKPSPDTMRHLWETLGTGAAWSPFQSPGFLNCFQLAMVPAVRGHLSVLEVRREGSSDPLLLVPVLRRRRGPFRIATFPDLGVADQCGPAIARAGEALSMSGEEFLEAILSRLPDTDLLEIRNMPGAIGGMQNPLAAHPLARPVISNLALDLQGKGDASAWRRKRVFKQIRSKWKMLRGSGVEFAECRTASEQRDLIDDILQLRQRRFQALGRFDTCQLPERQAFYRALTELAEPDNPTRGFALRCGDETVAGLLLLEHGDMVNPVLISIGAENWQRYSPGIVLMGQAIRHAEARGKRWFIFGTGLQDYKYRFGGTAFPMSDLVVPLTSAGELYLYLRRLKQIRKDLEATLPVFSRS
ncbi:GNAT family N-acetyltransferase [Roseibium aquae]|nr:GNAT family N-acetyltransferase [Roseibium aquae]